MGKGSAIYNSQLRAEVERKREGDAHKLAAADQSEANNIKLIKDAKDN